MAMKAIYKYLQSQNRPYSANDIVTNLQNEFSRADVQISLDKLVASKKIFEKDTTQDTDELMRINRELKSHSADVENKRFEVEKLIREHEAKLRILGNDISLDAALDARAELQISINELTKKLDHLMEANSGEDLGIEKRKADDILNDLSREYGKRKRLCTEIIDCILEGYPGSKKSLHDEIGIEIKLVQ